MFIKLLTEDEAEVCYKAIKKDTFDTGDKTQPLKSVKQNKSLLPSTTQLRFKFLSFRFRI